MTAAPAFAVDARLLEQARERLAHRQHLWWVLGAAGAGKSTVCRALAERHALGLIDMDEAIFGRFAPRYSAERHPANHAWFSPGHGLGWVLSLSWAQYDQFTRAADAEYLDLLSADLLAAPRPGPALVDGGLSHPSILAQVVPAAQIVTLAVPPATSVAVWNNEDRQAMQAAVKALPDGPAAWARFLDFNARLADAMIAESQASNIRLLPRDEHTEVAALAAQVAGHFGLP